MNISMGKAVVLGASYVKLQWVAFWFDVVVVSVIVLTVVFFVGSAGLSSFLDDHRARKKREKE